MFSLADIISALCSCLTYPSVINFVLCLLNFQ